MKEEQYGGVTGEGAQDGHKTTEGSGGKYGKYSKEQLAADSAALNKAVRDHAQLDRKSGSGNTDDGKKDNVGY